MGALNQDFRYPKSFQFFVALIFTFFLAFFVYTVAAVIGVFDTEIYSYTVSDIASVPRY